METPKLNLHLVSDATGETLNSIARATVSQFEHVAIAYHRWSLIRTRFQLHRVLEGIEAEKARAAAMESDRLRQAAENDKAQLRQQLLQQLNLILETRNSARGLIVNMSDVLFDTGKYTLRSGAREKLSKISGIVLSHPGLRLEVEGHTDSVGSDEYNQTLSEQRARAVQDYLVQQGIPSNSVAARGFGKTHPVVSNDTAAGRQQNRRVELVVSGDVIGTSIMTPSN